MASEERDATIDPGSEGLPALATVGFTAFDFVVNGATSRHGVALQIRKGHFD